MRFLSVEKKNEKIFMSQSISRRLLRPIQQQAFASVEFPLLLAFASGLFLRGFTPIAGRGLHEVVRRGFGAIKGRSSPDARANR
jgi:hypothetical protein